MLFRAQEHEPLRDEPWDERRVRAAIGEVVAAAEAALPAEGLWPAHERDRDEPEPPDAYTGVYLGAAGVAWALGRLGSAIDVQGVVERAYAR
jgi:hypothetical protein